ncbi:MAG: hypothetical protein ACK52S_14320, partial [Pirellula sp.]
TWWGTSLHNRDCQIGWKLDSRENPIVAFKSTIVHVEWSHCRENRPRQIEATPLFFAVFVAKNKGC